jgi:hypothetical protein
MIDNPENTSFRAEECSKTSTSPARKTWVTPKVIVGSTADDTASGASAASDGGGGGAHHLS